MRAWCVDFWSLRLFGASPSFAPEQLTLQESPSCLQLQFAKILRFNAFDRQLQFTPDH
jgi:hypothetical protein